MAALCFSQTAGSTLYVAVKSAELRNSPGSFAGVVATISLGDAVTVVETRGNWIQVRAGNQTGWTQSSGLRARRVVSSGPATAAEVSLAGKGFNSQVESEYRREGALNYAAVDSMEQLSIPGTELLDFINEGRLSGGK